MATYFHGSSEFQPAITATDGNGMQQTLFLINPNYVSFPDTHNPTTTATNMFFFNPASSSHAPPSDSTHFLGLPLPSPTPSTGPDHPNRPSPLLSGVGHNLWASSTVDHQQNNSPPGISGIHPRLLSAAETTADNSCGTHDAITQFGLRRPGMSPRQGLSLSLSSNQEPYRSSNVETVIHGQPEPPQSTSVAAGDIRISGSSPSTVSVVSNGIPGGQSVVMGSKYLRATQELLDEVVKVGKGLKTDLSEGTGKKIKTNKESTGDLTGEGSSAGENEAKPGPELTTAQRQELQMKKAKLVAMLDEVEHRYRQYRHQMQAVVVSFEHAAGLGAATSYTALALQTISKQFRCLKDAISDQIKATSKSLGEEDCLGAKIEGSRLRYVDHQLRQQRTLQQLGMIQPNNAWRPQRGLPERAVCVLRAWLFEHFLHPYPKDSDKLMLAKQTGLTRSQVSNWFINARVRLWKPMVEEMYMEEVKEKRERTDNGSEEDQIINTNKSDQQKESGSSFNAPSKPKSINQDNSTSPIDEFSNSTSTMGVSLLQQTPFNLIGSADLAGAGQRSPKRPRNDVQPVGILPMEMDMKESKTREINMMFGDERLFKDGYSYLNGTVYSSMREIGRFGGDEQQQLPPGFHGNGGVSLTLGLPHGDSLSLPGNHQQNFVVSNQNINELGGASQSGFATYDSIEMQNRKRFAAALLPDFVA